MPPMRWKPYDPAEKITLPRPGLAPLAAEIFWRQRIASNETVSYLIRATVSDEQGTVLFFVTCTRTSPSDPEAIAAIRRKVTDLVNSNSWTRDETYSIDGA